MWFDRVFFIVLMFSSVRDFKLSFLNILKFSLMYLFYWINGYLFGFWKKKGSDKWGVRRSSVRVNFFYILYNLLCFRLRICVLCMDLYRI